MPELDKSKNFYTGSRQSADEIETSNKHHTNDPFNLNRFISAQDRVYDRVLAELKNGRKRSHWMWYTYPQLDGLARSATSKYYAIKSREEAIAYLNHSVLDARLRECVEAVLAVEGKTVSEILGYPDDLKLKLSMTLFSQVTAEPIFIHVLDKYFQGNEIGKHFNY